MKTILVTGANGYIGGSFIKKYLHEFSFKKFSLLNDQLENIDFKDIDIVLHCAALVHQKSETNYARYNQINVEYPLELAKSAKKNNVKQFVFISTIAVYGEDNDRLNESTQCHPTSLYGKSKLDAENKLMMLADDNFTISIIRPPMVYGKDAPGNINSLIKLVKAMPIIPLGGIDNKRSFIYISNLCSLIAAVIERKMGGISLASDDTPISTTELINLIAQNLNKKVYLVKIPLFETFLKLLKPSFHQRLYGSLEVDNHLTKEKLNFKNPYSPQEGINLMIHGEK